MSLDKLKTWYWVHKWTSLICTVFLLILCLTGLPLIFHHEIDHALGDHAESQAMPADTPRADLDDIVADAKARRPADAVRFVSKDDWVANDLIPRALPSVELGDHLIEIGPGPGKTTDVLRHKVDRLTAETNSGKFLLTK